MKILIMCEGPNELKIINLLLDNNKLQFTRDDLLDMRPFHARQLTSPQLTPALNAYHGDLVIYRIGDTLNDSLKIPKDLSPTIIRSEKYCTKPEIEMLLIIAENLAQDYAKIKSKMRPKDYCKKSVLHNGKHYDNSTAFFDKYFGSNIDALVSAITEYHRTHKKHKANEKYLYDLLK